MAKKSANLYARMEPEIKEQAESISQTLGISDMSDLTEEQLDFELKKGYSDYESDKVNPVSKVFESMKEEYNI